MKRLTVIVCLVLLVALASAVAKADSASSYWGESWTDSSNSYHSPDTTQISGTLPEVIASIPTNVSQTPYADKAGDGSSILDGVNYVRTFAALSGASTYYDGSLLGDLSSKTGLTATFSLNNTAITSGAAFTASDFAGYTVPTENGGTGLPSPALRLTFSNASDPSNVWYSAPEDVLSMSNGQAVTLSSAFDPSKWTNINGISGSSDPTDFNAALSDVGRMGLAFGSGYFGADGFAFTSATGTGSLDLVSMDTVPAPAPEPGMIASLLGLGGMGLIGLVWRRKQAA